jgi:hypothetical protein
MPGVTCESPNVGYSLTLEEDNLNLRCFDQKRRFGFDLLYPLERYVNGLSAQEVPNRTGELVPNFLFTPRGDRPGRHPSRVILAGAIGVPWQDLSDEESWTGDGLRLLSPAELEDEGRWSVILGDPAHNVLPEDPLMIGSVAPRTGVHPLLGIPVGAHTSEDPQENPINGHEQFPTKNDDLQYACIFPLSEPRDCSDPNESNACDCNPEDLERNRPLCQPPGGGEAGTTQHFAKAYPGTRHLELLKAMGERAIVSSVCPKVVAGDRIEPAYGYNPLSSSILERAIPMLRLP